MRKLLNIFIAMLCIIGVTAQSRADESPENVRQLNHVAGSGIPPAKTVAVVKLSKEDIDQLTPEMVHIPGKNFEIGKYEVTQAEWRGVMGNNPSKFNKCGNDCPVEKVSWDDVQAYIQKLNAMTGQQYRLPSEAEWEFACYGGAESEYCGGDNVDAVAWTDARGNEETHTVGEKQGNGYGLYDMSGNVMEWTNDCWEGDCTLRVFRGGSWINDAKAASAKYRIKFITSIRNSSGGFRLARTIP